MRWKKLLYTFLFVPLSLTAEHIIFDLGDVLIETHALRSLWYLGPYKLSSYAARWKNPFACRQLLYDFLHELKALDTTQEITIKDEAGDALPHLMCEWLKGTLHPNQVLEHIYEALENASVFSHDHSIVQAVAEVVFTPSTFVKTRSLISEGISLVRECKRQGHKVYILSNWDAHSFELLQQEYPHVFNLFDGIVISGKVGLLKPHPGIYYHLMSTYNLNPQDCIYIDDQLDNIQAAQNLGIKAFHYKKRSGFLGTKHDFDPIRKSIFAN